VERLGRLPEMVLDGMDIKHVDAALEEGGWNIAFQLAFTEEWGVRHRCGTFGAPTSTCLLALAVLHTRCCLQEGGAVTGVPSNGPRGAAISRAPRSASGRGSS
jgi:hypothetical protein